MLTCGEVREGLPGGRDPGGGTAEGNGSATRQEQDTQGTGAHLRN